MSFSPDLRAAFVEAAAIFKARSKGWLETARPDQLPPHGTWRTWLIIGGRGAGKTRTGAESLRLMIDADRGGDYAIVAPTHLAVWKVCVEGPSGILAAYETTAAEIKAGRSKHIKKYIRQNAEIELHDGTKIHLASADGGADRVQGLNLKGVWADEIGMWASWEIAWDESIQMAVRIGDKGHIIATGTPKVMRPAAKLLRRLIKESQTPNDDGVYLTRMSRLRTVDNIGNLGTAFYNSVLARVKGTRLERQELEGELLDDIDGALWNHQQIDDDRVDYIPRFVATASLTAMPLKRVVVGVDPAEGVTDGDEQAYAVVGADLNNNLYVLESLGMCVNMITFLHHVIDAAVYWDASSIVVEKTGAVGLMATITQVMREMGVVRAVTPVSARQGKMTRAEPVAALYAQHRVHHLGHGGERIGYKGAKVEWSFADLEDQMCSFTGNPKEKSPDRMDALVWAATPFLNYTQGVPGSDTYSAWSEQLDGSEGVVAWS